MLTHSLEKTAERTEENHEVTKSLGPAHFQEVEDLTCKSLTSTRPPCCLSLYRCYKVLSFFSSFLNEVSFKFTKQNTHFA